MPCDWPLAPDTQGGFDTVLPRVVQVFGVAQPYHAYLFANRRSNRLKVLIHDGFSLWLTATRDNSLDQAVPLSRYCN
jgi:transposase